MITRVKATFERVRRGLVVLKNGEKKKNEAGADGAAIQSCQRVRQSQVPFTSDVKV